MHAGKDGCSQWAARWVLYWSLIFQPIVFNLASLTFLEIECLFYTHLLDFVMDFPFKRNKAGDTLADDFTTH